MATSIVTSRIHTPCWDHSTSPVSESMKPFAPPSSPEPRIRHAPTTGVLVAWLLTGGLTGGTVGISLQNMAGIPDAAVAGCMAGCFVFTLTGWSAITIERRHARARPALLDASGQRRRPLHVWVWALPALLAVPSLLWMVILGTVLSRSPFPAIAFAMTTVALLWGLGRLFSHHRLTHALESLELGEITYAKHVLERLQAYPFTTRTARSAARLNLGLLCAREGALGDAAYWYNQIGPGTSTSAFAEVGLGLIRVLEGDYGAAERHLVAATHSRGGRVIQAQSDSVRLLLVLRRDGAEAARTLGEQLIEPDSGSVFVGVLAFVRHECGDPVAAYELLNGASAQAILETGMTGVITELQQVLTRFRGVQDTSGSDRSTQPS